MVVLPKQNGAPGDTHWPLLRSFVTPQSTLNKYQTPPFSFFSSFSVSTAISLSSFSLIRAAQKTRFTFLQESLLRYSVHSINHPDFVYSKLRDLMIMASATGIPSATSNSSLYLDEKWKLSKKEGSSRSSSLKSSASFLSGNSSNRRCAFSRKCARLVKEQRARFYIMRRCVVMLICWRDYGDS
ncbi:hypothetical protein Cgig2_027137 [Carnegiea gigantea]|uniref:ROTUNDIFOLIA like 8 n=1 Tax=Carnegiea gigantea TaxID=171969 RepID=A0A9Q1K858_9CARY|nr:hypothetical protein Cgig2_027137 [Carnegiea gigantea]